MALKARDEQRAGSVACDVERRSAHVEDLVNASDDRNARDRDADGRQDHCQHDHASP